MIGTLISLRAPEPADIDALYAWENDVSVWHLSNTTAPYSKFAIEQYVLNTNQDIYAGRQLRLMIVPNDDPENPAGAIDLFDFDPLNRRAGVGILVIKDERGKGYAGEALNLLKDYCFNTLNLHQLYCHIAVDNEASIRLFSNAGFVVTGTRKEWTWSAKGWNDEIMLQLIIE